VTHFSRFCAAAGAMQAAIETGLMSQLLDGGVRPSTRELAIVLDVLVENGFAEERGGAYRASIALRDEHSTAPDGLEATWHLFLQTRDLLQGGGVRDRFESKRETFYRELAGKLGRFFEAPARQLAAELPIARGEILDVGAGSAIWSLSMARDNAAVHVTAVDFPEVLAHLPDHVQRISGDIDRVDLPRCHFDRAILGNVLHLYTPERARRLLHRVARSLRHSGDLVIVDMLNDGSPESRLNLSAYALHLILRVENGHVHATESLAEWCREVGLRESRIVKLQSPPDGLAALIARPNPRAV
jgi:SAM-dependent methyltransferase